ncbi:MAG: orotidine-5'-phosphate decarboxylase [Prevotella sp.]|nr:orotidine-5'-phosphate decarboxylase [Bacteroides sp.]MCM1366910.1 orotidine-5'-phosphate decarboxylase [Prevotella sp.]MCM1436705.1 orotidine-5'-phosphate decarboxylase [Prevotella sp.]
MTRTELFRQIVQKQSFLCVGLDPDIKKIPQHLLRTENPILEFCKQIVDATAAYAIAYKPNLAFFEEQGVQGWIAFESIVKYIRVNYPEIFIIADAKRGDIGNTSNLYARSFFETSNVDAITVAPYMGKDSVEPFLGYDGKWVILLALTSNVGSKDFQMLQLQNGKKLYEQVLETSAQWGSADELMYVVGATQGKLFESIRKYAPHNFLLVPGVGAQGGSLEEVCKYGMTAQCGLIVNSSRGIIYASSNEDFAEKASDKARELQLQMADILKTII